MQDQDQGRPAGEGENETDGTAATDNGAASQGGASDGGAQSGEEVVQDAADQVDDSAADGDGDDD